MRRLNRLLLFSVPLWGLSLSAQQSTIYTHPLKDYDKAVTLYNDKQYQAAQILFEKTKDDNKDMEVQADCAYYIANCAIRLEQMNADMLMENFVEDYPTSTKQNQAYVEVAGYYFGQGKYPQALQWYDKVDEASMSQADRDKYNFQKGYSYFSAGDKKQAEKYLNKVINSKDMDLRLNTILALCHMKVTTIKKQTSFLSR